MVGAHGLLDGHAYFLHWGVVQISLANFIVIALMVAIFVLALVLPFPHGRQTDEAGSEHDVHD
jgi:large-conductance mechanosensitive channel